MMSERFTLVCDNDCHDYVIPADRSAEWYAWVDLSEDDEASWNVPHYARAVGGRLTFTDPKYD